MALTKFRGTNFHTDAETHVAELVDSDHTILKTKDYIETKSNENSLLNALIFGG